MLKREDDVDACALHRQGWTISAIARHLDMTERHPWAYVTGGRTAGARAPARGDSFAPFVDYAAARLAEDPRLWASTLFDELLGLGFTGSYSTLTRQLRGRRLRPACEPCSPVRGRPVAVIEHPPGAETQWDWLELPTRPRRGGGASRRICWSARCRTRGAGAAGCAKPRASRTWSRAWTRSAGRWAG